MDLKGLLGAYEIVRVELEEVKRKPEILREKAEAMRKLLVELEGVIEAAHRRKGEALVSFAAGGVSEADIQTAREHLSTVLMQKTECEEFLSVAERAQQQLQKTISDLSVKITGCRHIFWNACAEELKSEITSDVIANVHAVFASRSLAGGAGTYENFLRQLFPLPPTDQAQKLQGELKEKYGFVE